MLVKDQIEMFASADFIVAAHGAGLANLMFCRLGTRVLELYSPNYVHLIADLAAGAFGILLPLHEVEGFFRLFGPQRL